MVFEGGTKMKSEIEKTFQKEMNIQYPNFKRLVKQGIRIQPGWYSWNKAIKDDKV